MLISRVLQSPKLAHEVLKSFISAGGYDLHVLSGLKLVDTKDGKISANFEIKKQHLVEIQPLGYVHGGLLATAVDIGGSLAIASKGLYATGVSTEISVSYISSAKKGDVISIEAKVEKLGRTLAFTTVELYAEEKLIALGRHNKFVAKAYQDPKNLLQQ